MANCSKYRNQIFEILQNRVDHPTADVIYSELKQQLPNIGIATIYRNLNQLEADGSINKITIGGTAHYDHRTNQHSHFSCINCGNVTDLDYDNEAIMELGRKNFKGTILTCSSNFYGICPECNKSAH